MSKTERPIKWNIQRKGRGWTSDELHERFEKLEDLKFEVSKGKLFWSEETRLHLLAMLLENVGLDAAVKLGERDRWKDAIAAAERG